jgi:hypothetical protein
LIRQLLGMSIKGVSASDFRDRSVAAEGKAVCGEESVQGEEPTRHRGARGPEAHSRAPPSRSSPPADGPLSERASGFRRIRPSGRVASRAGRVTGASRRRGRLRQALPSRDARLNAFLRSALRLHQRIAAVLIGHAELFAVASHPFAGLNVIRQEHCLIADWTARRLDLADAPHAVLFDGAQGPACAVRTVERLAVLDPGRDLDRLASAGTPDLSRRDIWHSPLLRTGRAVARAVRDRTRPRFRRQSPSPALRDSRALGAPRALWHQLGCPSRRTRCLSEKETLSRSRSSLSRAGYRRSLALPSRSSARVEPSRQPARADPCSSTCFCAMMAATVPSATAFVTWRTG